MAKRPTTRQIDSRIKRLERYQRATGKSDKEIAKELGIETSQVRRFKESPGTQRRGWSQAKASQKLYQFVGPPTGKGSSKVQGVRLLKAYTPKQRQAPVIRALSVSERDRIERSELVIERYTIRASDEQIEYERKLAWAEYTADHDLPISWRDIQDMYNNGEIDEDDYNDALDALKQIYGTKK